MTWIDDALGRAKSPLFINDSKTPSGVAHVGSLRGVLTHDAVLKVARSAGIEARFTYGCDDMDPLDEIPHDMGDLYGDGDYLGKPLFSVPPPPDMDGENLAQAFFGEFTANFAPLGVEAELYNTSHLYHSGQFDETIDIFLRNAAQVRSIYLRETGAQRPDNWLPFQPICEACGRIGTTFAFDYDGQTVAYQCRADLVVWATGCGAAGRVSPFGGRGKLPWKLEWVAKWKALPVTLEGGGKDHMGGGGAHKVSMALAREIVGCEVPASFIYEFFTLGGAKMSSSKGIGLSASELVSTLPPELLRYLVLKVQVKRALDFDLDLPTLNGAFGEYERLWKAVYGGTASANQNQLFAISQPFSRSSPSPPSSATEPPIPPPVEPPRLAAAEPPAYSPPFDSVVSIVAQPHINLADHIAKLEVGPLTSTEQAWLEVKRQTAKSWIARYSDSAERLVVAKTLPEAVNELSNSQRAFLSVAGRLLIDLDSWKAKDIQATLFDASRIVGLAPTEAFEALYTAFFGWPEGPRAGTFLEVYGRLPACERLEEVSYSYAKLVADTAIEYHEWIRLVRTAMAEERSFEVFESVVDVSASSPRVLEHIETDAKGRKLGRRTVWTTDSLPDATKHAWHVRLARDLGIDMSGFEPYVTRLFVSPDLIG